MNRIISLQSMARRGFLFGVIVVIIFFASFVGVQNANAAITSQLDLGSTGPNVVKLQTYLATDASIYPSGLITGHFDSFTQSAIQRFQVAEGIVSDGTPLTTGYGRVGPQTMVRINAFINLILKSSITSKPVLLVENSTALFKQEQTSSSLPVRLRISKIDVDATIEYVGLTSGGAMDMTKSLENVAWFDLGPRPGEDDSAVIGGHYDGRENGKLSVFDNLHKLRQGDKLSVEDDNGAVISFVVREIRMYDVDMNTPEVFTSDDGKSHLNLITCAGAWNKVSESYPQRLVVFTDKE